MIVSNWLKAGGRPSIVTAKRYRVNKVSFDPVHNLLLIRRINEDREEVLQIAMGKEDLIHLADLMAQQL